MSVRKTWDKIKMKEAVTAVKKKEMGLLKASKAFNVPRSTLKDYVKKHEDELQTLLDVPLGRRPVLSLDVEKQLVEYCLEMDKIHFGLATKDLKRMAFQLAIRNNLPHPFSGKTKSAGRKWLRLFFKRHPALSHWERKNSGKATTLENPSTSGKTSDISVKEEPSSSAEIYEEPAYYVSTDDSDSSCNEEDDETQCKICEGFYCNDYETETWLICGKCNNCFHEKCDTRTVKNTTNYVCVECSKLFFLL